MVQFNRRYFLQGVVLPELFEKERSNRPVFLSKETTNFNFLHKGWTKKATNYSWDNSFCTLVGENVRKYQFKITDVQLKLSGETLNPPAKKPGYYCHATSESCKKYGTSLKFINYEFARPMLKVGDFTTVMIPLKIKKIVDSEPEQLSSLTPVNEKKEKRKSESKRKLARKKREEDRKAKEVQKSNGNGATETGDMEMDANEDLEFGSMYKVTDRNDHP
jgi:hypothetical protein